MRATWRRAPLRRNAPASFATSRPARVRRSEKRTTRRAWPAGAAASSASASASAASRLLPVAAFDLHRREIAERMADRCEVTVAAVHLPIDGDDLDRCALEVVQERRRAGDAGLAQRLVERARPVEDDDDLRVPRHATKARRRVDPIAHQRLVVADRLRAERAADGRRPRGTSAITASSASGAGGRRPGRAGRSPAGGLV